MNESAKSLSELVNVFQGHGRYVMTSAEAAEALRCITAGALQKAFQRLCAQGRLLRPCRGFYVIVPVEYRSVGSPPVTWFIDDLMNFMKVPYYMGGLSAAELHGAAHQRIQETQVVVPFHVRMIQEASFRIRFLQNGSMNVAPVENHRTHTGVIPVSTPEWTALDLVRFQKHLGGVDTVGTVLKELAESMNAERLGAAVRLESCNAYIQRLGWLLEWLERDELAEVLYAVVKERDPSFVLLIASKRGERGKRDGKWRIWVNEQPEPDL
jgi:predicted transcriptional regulator of viral defense system